MADNKGNVLPGNTDFEKLEYLCQRTYKAQAVWFLNAFWDSFGEGEAENLWNYVHKAVEIDLDHREAGTHLNEMEAHRLLESFDETMTVREMRTYLRQHGAIGERVKNVPLTHWWIAKYKADWAVLVNAPQGDNSEAIEKAQAMLESAQAALNEATARANEAANALRQAIAAEDAAKAREAEAKAAEAAAVAREDSAKSAEAAAVSREQAAKSAEAAAKAAEEQAHARAEAAKASEEAAHTRKEELAAKEIELEAAQAELEAALAELKAQEDAYNAKTAELTKKSEEGGVVSRNRAKNELAQHLAEDPLPLRRAKITMEAAVKKADRARNAVATARVDAEAAAEQASKDRAAAEQAAAEASAARQAAEQARAHSEQAKAAADTAREEAERQVAAAEEFLHEEMSKPGQAYGALWWIERELFEAKKYMPTSKGGIAK
mmetsp:Transcript_25890/g.65030  ORF Transcript_25890/g.65030 Transcript_25890/m.65030 type:complete len:436 (+) Transcript_25890:144-1451(+)